MSTSRSLFSLVRGGFEEIIISGEIVVCDAREVIFQTSEIMRNYPARSLLKPFQFLADQLPMTRWSAPEASSRYTACLGSISATEPQVRALRTWYASPEAQALMEKLQVPASYPMDEKHRTALKNKGAPPERIFHTCFSKHMAILESCQAKGWDLADYFSVSHPYQGNLLDTLSACLGETLEGTVSVTDGCGLPSPVLSLAQLARLYQRLAAAPHDSPLGTIRQLMVSQPEWIGGPGRADTRLMQQNPQVLVVKEGADGLLGLGVTPSPQFPSGLGIVLKLAAGYLPPYFAISLAPVLEKLGLRPLVEKHRGQELVYHYEPFAVPPRAWTDISPTLEEGIAVFPGDREFSRSVSHSVAAGHHYSLSSIQTTLHVGAHTDAPNHYQSTGLGIDQVPLETYSGPCQVVEVPAQSNGLIVPGHLAETAIVAPRVLFKTGSFPDPRKYNTDFMGLSAELVRFLAARKVILVGIDTPSIDPSESKDLPAHHAVATANLAILEGIVLEGVAPGVYELAAFPLKIKDGDASPVRAALRPL